MKNDKSYKVSFKTYLNERLKPVSFHGIDIYPLYVQVTFDRQSIYFKSYYFDLLSQPQYVARHFTGNRNPSIEEIRIKEERLSNFIIEKYGDDFSLEVFQEKYNYYSRDLLNMMESGFKEYLWIFFNDEGDNLLASMIHLIGRFESGINITDSLKRPLKTTLYDKMIANAAYYAPPYLPLMQLAKQKGEGKVTTLSVYEWESKEIQDSLDQLLEKSFPNYARKKIDPYINEIIQQT